MVTAPSAFNPNIDIATPKDYRESEALKPGKPIPVEGQAANQLTPTGVRNADVSGQLAYSGAAGVIGSVGNMAGQVATQADTVAKNYIEDKIYTAIDKEKDAYTRTLQGLNAAGKGGNVGPNLGWGESILGHDPTAVDVPDDISTLDSKVSALGGAKASGKITQTEYYGRLASMAKDFRNNYSGWRDFVDAKISHEVGGDPANMYIRSMVASINQANASANATQKGHDNFARHNIQTGNIGPDLQAKVATGDPAAIKAMYTQVYNIENKQRLNKELHDSWTTYNVAQKGQDDMNVRTAATDVATEVYKDIVSTNPDYGDDSPTPQARFDMARKMSANPNMYTPEQKAQTYGALKAAEAATRARITQEYTTKQANGKTKVEEMFAGNMTAFNKMLDDNTKIYQEHAHLISTDNFGAMEANTQLIKTNSSMIGYLMFRDPTLNKAMSNVMGLRAVGGDNYLGAVASEISAAEGISKHLKSFVWQNAVDITAQPDKLKGGPTRTVPDIINDAKKNADLGTNHPGVFDRLLKTVGLLGDPKVPDTAKKNIVDAAYSKTWLDMIAPSSVDPKTGRSIPGNLEVFNSMTSQPKIDSVVALDKSDPAGKHVEKLRNWTGAEFDRLFHKQIVAIGPLVGNGRVTFDDKNLKFEIAGSTTVRGLDGTVFSNPRQNDIRSKNIQSIVNDMNYALKSMARVSTSTGGDGPTEVLQTLKRFGYDPKVPEQDKPVYAQQPAGSPFFVPANVLTYYTQTTRKMWDAVVNSRRKKVTEE